MTIELYQNKSDAIYLNKTINYYATITGTLRDACSLLNPIILFEYSEGDTAWIDVVDGDNEDLEDDLGFYNPYNILDANYCYIREFNRYYYITNITIISNKIYSLSMAVDVLMSYKDKILDLDAYVSRNENDYNLDIKDDLTNFKWTKDVIKLIPPTYQYHTTLTEFKTAGLTDNLVFTYMTKDNIYTSYSMPASFANGVVSTYMTASNMSTQYLVTTSLHMIVKEVFEDSELLGFIKSAKVYPYTISTYFDNDKTTIKIGDEEVPLHDTFKYPRQAMDKVVIADFVYSYVNPSFLQYTPYTTYELWLPYHKYVQLNGEDILNQRILVYYIVNYETGDAHVYVYNQVKDIVLYESIVTLGTNISLSASNTEQLNNQKISLALNTAINTIGSVLSIGTGVATGNPIVTAGGILNATKTLGNAIVEGSSMYQSANVSCNSSDEGLTNFQKVHLKLTITRPVGYDANYFKLYGRPLYENRKLSNLTGYTRVADVHLSNWTATLDEQELVRQLLFNGIVI